ncbi:MAG: DCC1-like thiol-disulfide oxidoreductase family protein [Leptolyngbyaceae bacterium]|nr:DCC1-like thiol-disulfide oxidoreductase family protein [Leptolyngbyaceae bacterium]
MNNGDRPIVFFDGECVMCNRFVDLLLHLDPDGVMAIAPLQGETARQLLPPLPGSPERWSIYYLDETGLFSQSTAALKISQRLGGGWSCLGIFLGVPQPIRDGIYRLVARNRYQIMGKYSTCRVPSDKDRDRFLP